MNFLSILSSFEDKQIRILKEDFDKEFAARILEEKEYCAKTNQEVRMTPEVIREIEGLARKCWSAYHIEALKRLVLQEMLVPTIQDVDEKANRMMTEALHV